LSIRVVIINTGSGNLFSLRKALIGLKAHVLVSSDAHEINAADKVILPGVGHFATAMTHLREPRLFDCLNNYAIHLRKPVLGICLGMQIMAHKSEEGPHEGLGWINADVIKLSVKDRHRYKVPHICWNGVRKKTDSPLTKNISTDSLFYFLHSYYVQPADTEIISATTLYESEFPSVMTSGNLFGVQFHPEKSHKAGLHLLENFLKV
jgi:glutamine amidotransferase